MHPDSTRNCGPILPPIPPPKKSPNKKTDNVCFKAEQGQLIAIVGGTGQGKSSLLNAVMGEMSSAPNQPYPYYRGNVAYVPQQVCGGLASFPLRPPPPHPTPYLFMNKFAHRNAKYDMYALATKTASRLWFHVFVYYCDMRKRLGPSEAIYPA